MPNKPSVRPKLPPARGANPSSYPYLYGWCKMLGSKSYYLQDQLQAAAAEGAPADAIYKRDDGTWARMAEFQGTEQTRQIVESWAEFARS